MAHWVYYGPQVNSGLFLIFKNQVLLNTPMCPTHVGIIYGCFLAMTVELGPCTRNHIAHKAEDIYYIAIYRNSLHPLVLYVVKCKCFVEVS